MGRRLLLALATVAAAAASLPLLPRGDAAILRREAIEPSDTVLADHLVPGEWDEYVLDLPRNAVAKFTLAADGPGGWRPQFGVFTDAFAQVPLEPTLPLRTVPLAASGLHHMIVGNAATTVGAYRFRVVLAPQRSAAARGTGDGAPAPLVLGALEDSTLDVTIRWKGAAPVTLAAIDGPDGVPLIPPAGAEVRRSSSVQRGFEVTARGDQSARFVVPPGTVRWSASIRVRPPRLGGITRDFRTTGVPSPPTVALPAAGALPLVLVEGEEGGPNEILFSGGTTVPAAFATGGSADTGPCGFVGSQGDTTQFELRCRNGYSASVTDIVRDGLGRIVSFEVSDVRTPRGTGSVTFSDMEYDDASGLVSAWHEVRRFDATGGEHSLDVSGVRRLGNGVVFAFDVTHTGPDGTPRTYQYGFSYQ